MGTKVSVAGASGYAGGELLRLVLGHPELELGAICAASAAGKPVTGLHPGLLQLAGEMFAPTDVELLSGADLVFLALPHGESAGIVAGLGPDVRVVDLGADFRLRDAGAWTTYYGGSHPHAGTWTYGLPELPGAREQVAASTRVANPGCYATAVTLGLAPLLSAGLVEPGDVVVVAASGTSGAGRKATDGLLATTVMGGVSAYKTGGVHQHTPEIEQSLTAVAGATVTLSFTPMLAPMPRGILATCTARLTAGATTAALREAMLTAYGTEPFVRLLADGVWPTTKATAGSNGTVLQVVADAHAGRAVVSVALDNLGKGAAGQAVQNANLMLGIPETVGLSATAVGP
jgi:N-acetyl-gamma-glutamyl-phosphate reductase